MLEIGVYMYNTSRKKERERHETLRERDRETHTKLVIKKRHAVLLRMKH